MTDKAPLWQVEDALTAARQEAQEADTEEARRKTREKIEHALELLDGEARGEPTGEDPNGEVDIGY